MRLEDVRAHWMPLIGWTAVVFAIGYVDYVTGPFFSLTLLYLLPVAGGAWTNGRIVGVLVALAAGAASFTSDIVLSPQASGVPLFWNTGSRTVVLVVAAVAIDLIRRDRERLKLLDSQRGRALQLLDQGLAAPARQIVEFIDHWDGSLVGLKGALRPRAEEIGFLARDFSTMVKLQSGALPLSCAAFDLTQLIDELRSGQTNSRTIALVRPSAPLLVLGDRARARQALNALMDLAGAQDDLAVSVTARPSSGEVVFSSQAHSGEPPAGGAGEDVGLTVELAQLLLTAQGGTVELARNPITRTSRITARLPLA